MLEFINDYKGALKPHNKIGIKNWIYFTLKSFLLLVILFLMFSLAQYMVIMYTPLSEYVTVPGIESSNLYALMVMLVISFGPSMLYLFRIIFRRLPR